MADKDSMELISALIDGELAERDMHDAIRAMRSNHDRCCSWERYHLIGDSLRNNLPTSVDRQFLNRISDALVSEPVLNATPAPQLSPRKNTSIRPVAGFALAASVALTAFIGVGMLSVDETGQAVPPMAKSPPSEQPDAPVQVAVKDDDEVPAQTPVWDGSASDFESKFNTYLTTHQSYSTPARVNHPVLPNIRLVNETSISSGQ